MSDLRERVAEAMWMADPDPYDPADWRPFSEADWEARRNYLAEADAAIALVLEEAAKVADEYEGKGFTLDLHTQAGDAYVTRSDIAAAIRALKGKSDE